MAMEDQAKLGSQMLGVYQQELGNCFLNFFGGKMVMRIPPYFYFLAYVCILSVAPTQNILVTVFDL